MARPKKKTTRERVDITLHPKVKELARLLADEDDTSMSGLIEGMILRSAKARKVTIEGIDALNRNR